MGDYLNTLVSSDYDPQCADASTPTSACLSNDDILAFVQGDWDEERIGIVHGHLDSCDLCQRLVSEAAHALDSEPISESARPSWNTVFQPNTLVGQRYRIQRLIARGGMGEVYEAYDADLQERVALKTVTSTACDSARAVRSLKAEVHLTRRINHPNICRIYDFRTHIVESSAAAIHFLVMEFVDGESLGKKLRGSGALSVEQSLTIAHQLLLGLRAAHHAGILHRDLKSDNVMLRTDSNGQISPVILDFGLAKVLNESGHAATTVTQGHAMIGTIGYMAPEQVAGEALTVASDLYALGCVWFEMLTGQLPFASGSLAVSAVARLHRSPAAPSSLNPDVPRWLDEMVLRCLNRRPQRRFESAEQVLDALAYATAASPSTRGATRGSWLAVSLVALLTFCGVFFANARLRPNAHVGAMSVQPLSPISGSPKRKGRFPRPSILSWPAEARASGAVTRQALQTVGKPTAPTKTMPQSPQRTSVPNVLPADKESSPASSNSASLGASPPPAPKNHHWEPI